MSDKKPASFDDLVAPFPPGVQATAQWLRSLLMDRFPLLIESFFGGGKVNGALYGVGEADRVAVGIQPGVENVKLYIHDPEFLPESQLKLEGSGRHMRHVKFEEPAPELSEEILRLVSVPIERRSATDG